MTNNQSPYTECQDHQECGKVARDKWWDAVALFEADRYSSTLYMAGYAIEIGIKAEFHRLADEPVTFNGNELLKKMQDVHKGENPELELAVKQWLETYPHPPRTLKELLLFLQKTESFFTRGNTREELRPTYKCPAFSVIIENRSPKGGGTLHNTEGFLGELKTWKEKLGQPTFHSELYILPYWNTEMRYSNHDTSEQDALKAVKTALSFLKEVLIIGPEDVREMEEKLNQLAPQNQLAPIDGNLQVVNINEQNRNEQTR
jgi:HEPN domain-containing protein